jgi:hypothetical protein
MDGKPLLEAFFLFIKMQKELFGDIFMWLVLAAAAIGVVAIFNLTVREVVKTYRKWRDW